MMSRFFVFLFIIFITSCSSKKDIVYLQDFNDKSQLNIEYAPYLLKIDDILKINVYLDSPEASMSVNKSVQIPGFTNTKDAIVLNGYKINTDGYITFPSVGKIFAKGKSIEDISSLIEEKLKENEIFNNPYVDVKLLNAHFTIIGEVNRPGRYEFLKNNLTIFEALGFAGDLTINGKRDDIKIIREISDKTTLHNLDLTNSDFISGEFYQVQSGDIIIVNPNSNRIKNAGIIGNSGTLISLLSFLMSSIIVINAN